MFQFSGPGSYEHSYWTRVIDSYDHWRATWAERNELHTKTLELAAADKNLFINSSSTRHVELKFPEYVPHPIYPRPLERGGKKRRRRLYRKDTKKNEDVGNHKRVHDLLTKSATTGFSIPAHHGTSLPAQGQTWIMPLPSMRRRISLSTRRSCSSSGTMMFLLRSHTPDASSTSRSLCKYPTRLD